MLDCAQQDEFCLYEVAVHAVSYHQDRSKDHNEVNPGLGIKIKAPDSRIFLTAGGYKNSLYRTTFYAGVGADFPIVDHVGLRFTAGILTGYELPIVAAVVPELVVSAGGYGVAIGYIPKFNYNGRAVESVVSLSLFKRF